MRAIVESLDMIRMDPVWGERGHLEQCFLDLPVLVIAHVHFIDPSGRG